MLSSLLFGVLVVLFTDISAEHNKHRLTSCLSEDVLLKRVDKLLHRSVWKTGRMPGQPAAAGSAQRSCSDFSGTHFTADFWNRSLSPWRIITHFEPDMYPQTYEKAECLCAGCIIKGKENTDYNSVEVTRSVMFLRKVPCGVDPEKYSLIIEHKTIPVACTCVMPRQ